MSHVWHELRASRQLAGVLGTITLLALLAALLIEAPLWLRAGLAVTVLISGGRSLIHHALRRGNTAITAVRLNPKGTMETRDRAGRVQPFPLHPRSTLLGSIILLRNTRPFAPAIILLPDALSPDSQRQIRAWLRWKALGA